MTCGICKGTNVVVLSAHPVNDKPKTTPVGVLVACRRCDRLDLWPHNSHKETA